MKKIVVASLSLSILLSGCAQVTNEGVGTVTGGVLGGLIGSQFGGGAGKVAAAAGGAVLGAFLGGRIGQYMDRQDKMEMQRADQMLQLKAHRFTAGQGRQLQQHLRRPATIARESHTLIKQQRLNAAFGGRHLADVGVAQLHQMSQFSIAGRWHMNAAQLSAA